MAIVTLEEKEHKYTDETGKVYISVTTVIGKYKQPFDEEYWSLYKAIEKYVIERKGEDFWKDKKRSIGYENIIPYFYPKKISDLPYLEVLRKEILDMWEEKRVTSAANGTAYHKGKEDETNSQKECKETNLPIIVTDRVFNNLKSGVYSELTLWDESLTIAGQADKVIIDGGYVDIDDYKTSETIDKVSFKHYINGYRMMQYPVVNLMDCNYFHYNLQLSIYALFIERKGFTPRRLRIEHSRSGTWMEVPYLRNEAIRVTNHYAETYGINKK